MTAADAFQEQQTRLTLPRQRPSGESAEHGFAPPLRLRVRRPRPRTAVVLVRGEVDVLTAPRLTELLVARLRGTLRTLVVDLSEVDFLGAAGLSSLLYADLLARHRGVTMRVVTGDNRWAIRPLTVTGIGDRLNLDRTR
ncbi:STAS domain-containing protein [Amycolatopsis acidiphila]|uniref:STAS domain-containing protein n=1 Tax=Amycolatopsis acidiphila TaxID=715473 RepID=UPI001643B1AD|nr:STAS domain-containing protein [Amycolatopsis acidiphila]UIJ63567.1 STAS domain-containing protein [Amycolatopsis acidiphila]